MTNSPVNLTRNQTATLALGTVVVALVVVWLVLSIGGNGTPSTSTTATPEPPPTDTTTTAIETTTTALATTTSVLETTTTTTTEPSPTTPGGVFDEVGAVEAFVEDFAEAIDAGDSSFLFERLHPAVKATYEDDLCRAYIDDRVLLIDDYLQVGPVTGPFDSEFGEFPITSYEVRVSFEIDGDQTEEQAVFSLTEGVVRWFAECS